MKSSVLRLAHALRKTGLTLSAALKRAWAAIKLKLSMATSSVSFFYLKDDGSERFAVGNDSQAPARSTEAPTKSGSPLVIKYFDTLAGGWRSFRADRLLIN